MHQSSPAGARMPGVSEVLLVRALPVGHVFVYCLAFAVGLGAVQMVILLSARVRVLDVERIVSLMDLLPGHRGESSV